MVGTRQGLHGDQGHGKPGTGVSDIMTGRLVVREMMRLENEGR